MEIPFVTIVLFAYNGERYIREALESLLNQTYRNFELLIIEDKSTDRTLDILREYRDDRIKLICNKLNIGIARNRQIALKEAKGKYIFWMDNDDISHHQRIEKQVVFLEMHPEVVLCGTATYLIGDSDNTSRLRLYPTSDSELKANMFFGFPFMSPSVGLRMEALSGNTFEFLEKVDQADDYTLYSTMMLNGEFANLSEPLYYYREHLGEYRITTDKEKGYQIVAGRKTAWNLQLEHFGLMASDAVLNLHDKLSYYDRLINSDDTKSMEAYLSLLESMLLKSEKYNIDFQIALKKNVSRKAALLFCNKYINWSVDIKARIRHYRLLKLQEHIWTLMKKLARKSGLKD